jgi:hypothetical protein
MWFIDTLVLKVKLLLGNKVMNVFMNVKFMKVVPMQARTNAGESLINFTNDVGIPEMLTMDGAGEFSGRYTDFVRHVRRMRIKLFTLEQGRKNQNHVAE